MVTRTLFVDLNKLNRDKEIAAILIRLMMACNDLSLVNTCMSRYKNSTNSRTKYIDIGAAMYFVRLQIGHLHEGLKIINDARGNQNIMDKIKTCSYNARDLFDMLCKCMDGGLDKDKFEKYFHPIRHNLIFHYHESGKWIKKALKDRIEIRKQKSSKVTFGHIGKMRYELADEIIDSIVCRNLFGIPYDVDLQTTRKEVDDILDYGFKMAEALLVVSSELIYKYSEDFSAL